ncbi:MAG: hypothetical protein KF842_07015 [Caulobacter sp.]|nr:hypothetical protein [Caulobacter sp.]
MTVTEGEASRFETDRVLGLINYGLLFASLFFAGVPGIVAVVIAYAQRGGASPQMHNHYRFQIRIFWIAFLLGLIAGVCGLWAVLDFAGQIWGNGQVSVDEASGVDINVEQMDLTPQVIGLFIASGVSLVLMTLWALVAPAVGFIRLITATPPQPAQ